MHFQPASTQIKICGKNDKVEVGVSMKTNDNW